MPVVIEILITCICVMGKSNPDLIILMKSILRPFMSSAHVWLKCENAAICEKAAKCGNKIDAICEKFTLNVNK